jgi:prophage antirepressor-like protein
VFTFPETAQHVRSVMIDAEPWWVARDVADVLELGNVRSSLALLDEDEKGVHTMDTLGGTQQVAIVNEPGLYSLILRSRKPQAKAFKRWITHEVIPSIRRTGSYSAPAPALPDMSTPQGRVAVARLLLESTEREVELTSKVAELEPKALAHDTLMAAQDGDVLVRQAAKTLGWRERELRGFLLDERLIYRRQRTCGGWEYDFYAAHADCFNAVEKVVEHTWGSCAHYTLHVTPRGMSFIQMRMDKRAAAMREALQGGAA